MIAFAIKDPATGEYFRQRRGAGWYSQWIVDARLYGGARAAQQTISGSAHVTYPARSPIVVRINIKEETNDETGV